MKLIRKLVACAAIVGLALGATGCSSIQKLVVPDSLAAIQTDLNAIRAGIGQVCPTVIPDAAAFAGDILSLIGVMNGIPVSVDSLVNAICSAGTPAAAGRVGGGVPSSIIYVKGVPFHLAKPAG